MSDNVSFSNRIKEELIDQPINKKCCQKVFLYNILKNGGSIIGSGEGAMISLRMPSMSFVRKVGQIFKLGSDIAFTYIYRVRDNLSGNDYYQCIIQNDPKAEKLLRELSLKTSLFGFEPPPDNLLMSLEKKCCQTAFIKSIIITCGYFQDPKKNYHFEIRIKEPFMANIIRRILMNAIGCKIKTHLIKNGDLILLYSKSFENFEKLLAYLNVTKSYFELENIKIIKEIKNDTNRGVNFETANIQRTANIAMQQISKIKALLKSRHAEKLTAPLLEIAKLRIANPHLSLSELAALTRPKITKSAVNNRFMRIMQMYKKYEAELK